MQWLKGKVTPGANFSMLDYGGADGKFLPDLPGRKHVFDISDVAAAPGIKKIKSEAELISFSYIQLAHILEHVPFPLALARRRRHSLTIQAISTLRFPKNWTTTPGEGLRSLTAEFV